MDIVAIHEARRLDPGHYDEMRRIWKSVLDFVYGAIGEMQAQGKAKKLNKAFSAFALIGMCSWLFYWFDSSRKESAGELFETFNEIFFRGLPKSGEDSENAHSKQVWAKKAPFWAASS